MIGETINERFQVLEKIGDGGCGSIHRAFDSETEQEVAVKVAKEEPKYGDMMIREAALLRLFSDENIVRYIDSGSYQGRPFMAMELLEGKNLSEMLESGIEWVAGKEIILQVCSALKAVHNKGLVHRDVKPANVFVTEYGAKLLDFGIVSLPGCTAIDGDKETISGTPNYIAPEILAMSDFDQRSDIYSIGVMMFNLLTGRPLLTGGPYEVVLKALNYEPVKPSMLKEGISPELDRIVLKALSKNPDERYQSIEELAHELGNCDSISAAKSSKADDPTVRI